MNFFRSKYFKIFVNDLKSIKKIQVRFYPRWQQRTARKLFLFEEHEQCEKQSDIKHKSKYDSEHSCAMTGFKIEEPARNITRKQYSENLSKPKNLKIKVLGEKNKCHDKLNTVIDIEGNLFYKKLRDKDPTISNIMAIVKSRKQREKENLALIEGKRVIIEALKANCSLKYLLFSRKSDLDNIKKFLPSVGTKIFKMSYRELQMWSDLITSPGIIGVIKIPSVQEYISLTNTLPLIIICDNIREPGNLGAILRIAAGVGAERVFLTKGCVNLWEPKVIRSAMGAHFKLRIHSKLDWVDIHHHLNANTKILIADNNISDRIENKSIIKEDKQLFTSFQNIPILPYYNINFPELNQIVLIVGGETEGLSVESYKAALKYKGVRLNIPLKNDIDSLNAGTALAVIAFEISKQFSIKM